MVSGTTLEIRPSLVVSLSTRTANDDGSRDSAYWKPHLLYSKSLTALTWLLQK